MQGVRTGPAAGGPWGRRTSSTRWAFFDYLADKVAIKVIAVLYANLKPGGIMLIGNFADHIIRPHYGSCNGLAPDLSHTRGLPPAGQRRCTGRSVLRDERTRRRQPGDGDFKAELLETNQYIHPELRHRLRRVGDRVQTSLP